MVLVKIFEYFLLFVFAKYGQKGVWDDVKPVKTNYIYLRKSQNLRFPKG